MKLKYVLSILLFLNITLVQAADLRGKFTGLNGARVEVSCPGLKHPSSSKISSSGSFAITNLPANKSCNFIVSHPNAKPSSDIPFSTRNSVTIYNGRLRIFNNRVVVIRR